MFAAAARDGFVLRCKPPYFHFTCERSSDRRLCRIPLLSRGSGVCSYLAAGAKQRASAVCSSFRSCFRILVTFLVFALRGHAKPVSSARVTAPPPESSLDQSRWCCEDVGSSQGSSTGALCKVSPHSIEAWVAGMVCVHPRKYSHLKCGRLRAHGIKSSCQGFPAGPTALRPRTGILLSCS